MTLQQLQEHNPHLTHFEKKIRLQSYKEEFY